jgi:hypothetical protein
LGLIVEDLKADAVLSGATGPRRGAVIALPIDSPVVLTIYADCREQQLSLMAAQVVTNPVEHTLPHGLGSISGVVIADIVPGNPLYGDVREGRCSRCRPRRPGSRLVMSWSASMTATCARWAICCATSMEPACGIGCGSCAWACPDGFVQRGEPLDTGRPRRASVHNQYADLTPSIPTGPGEVSQRLSVTD